MIKLGVNILFNAETTQSAIGALTTTMWENNHYADTRVACHELAKKVIAAIQRKHYRIADSSVRTARADIRYWIPESLSR